MKGRATFGKNGKSPLNIMLGTRGIVLKMESNSRIKSKMLSSGLAGRFAGLTSWKYTLLRRDARANGFWNVLVNPVLQTLRCTT